MNRYLYTIWLLHRKYCCVRSVDIAHHLGRTKPSVSVFVRQMQKQGLIEIEPDGNLCFTNEGRIHAEQLDARVSFFQRFLIGAGVEASVALQDATAFGWEMSDSSFEAFKRGLTSQLDT